MLSRLFSSFSKLVFILFWKEWTTVADYWFLITLKCAQWGISITIITFILQFAWMQLWCLYVVSEQFWSDHLNSFASLRAFQKTVNTALSFKVEMLQNIRIQLNGCSDWLVEMSHVTMWALNSKRELMCLFKGLFTKGSQCPTTI